MIWLYANYPNARITAHSNPSCGLIRRMGKRGQRVLAVKEGNVTSMLAMIRSDGLPFASTSGLNDVWFRIEMGDSQQEEAAVRQIRAALGASSGRLAGAMFVSHC